MHELLEKLGLTKSEIAVYLALIEIGTSTTGPIIKYADIASGKAYLILDKLMEKGLVTYTNISGTKHYQAKDPSRLMDYFSQQEQELQELGVQLQGIIPELEQKYTEQLEEVYAEVYEGIKGFKTFHKLMLDETQPGETIYVFGVPREANEKYNSFYVKWNQQRVEKGVKLHILYNADNKKYGSERRKLPLTQVRYMAQDQQTPAWIDVFGDYVVTMNIRSEPRCFLIKDKVTAQSYLQYFQTLWEHADQDPPTKLINN